MKITNVLSDIKNQLKGRTITDQESDVLLRRFNQKIPEWYVTILQNFPIRRDFELSEEFDESGLGASLRWMTPSQIISEATESYPGIAAILLDYIPCGICLEGSGDYYYVQSENIDPALVRIPHTAIDGKQQLILQDIEIVSSHLSKFFEMADL